MNFVNERVELTDSLLIPPLLQSRTENGETVFDLTTDVFVPVVVSRCGGGDQIRRKNGCRGGAAEEPAASEVGCEVIRQGELTAHV